MRLFNDMPPQLRDAVKDFMSALQRAETYFTRSKAMLTTATEPHGPGLLLPLHPQVEDVETTSESCQLDSLTRSDSGGLYDSDESGSVMAKGGVRAKFRGSLQANMKFDSQDDDDEIGSMEGYFRTLAHAHGMSDKFGVRCSDWDPETGSLQKVYLSGSIGDMFGMHPEEFIARIGNRELTLLNTQLDFFCGLINEISTVGLCSRISRVVMLDLRTGKVKETGGILVRTVSLTTKADALGRMMRSIRLIDPISPEEYDYMGAGRDLLFSDQRSGQELLEDTGKDYLFDETISSLHHSPQKFTDIITQVRLRTEYVESAIETAKAMTRTCQPDACSLRSTEVIAGVWGIQD
jgi:hypothetical protein